MNEKTADSGTNYIDTEALNAETKHAAVEWARLRSAPRSAMRDSAAYRARGVEWVRPTDLMARGSARVAGAGINFQSELRRRTHKATRTSVRGIAEHTHRLPPLSAFGRGTPRSGTGRAPIGTA